MATIIKRTKNYTYSGNKNSPMRLSNTMIKTLDNPTILACPDKTWRHPNHVQNEMIILSPDNSKVKELGQTVSELVGTKVGSVSYGKSTILSCPFAGSCVRFCYQNKNKYPGSNRLHANNYFHIYGRSKDYIVNILRKAIDALKPWIKIVRLNDNGDFMSLNEILAWLEIAREYSDIVFYGYTKNTPHTYKARQIFGQFPSNYRVAISNLNENDATHNLYADKIRRDYGNEIYTCYIIDTPERDKLYQDIPFNDGEMEAYTGKRDFKIAIHVEPVQYKDCTDSELAINSKYPSGGQVDGIATC